MTSQESAFSLGADSQNSYESELYCSCMDKARRQAVYQEFLQHFKDKIQREGIESLFTSEVGQNLIKSYTTYKFKTLYKMTPDKVVALFITLSPEPGTTTVNDIHMAVHKFLKPNKGLKDSIYCLEQSGTQENIGYHPHAHILWIRDIDHEASYPNKIIARAKRHFTKFRTKSPHYLDIKMVTLKKLQDKIDYIMGLKTDPLKQPILETDKKWRKEKSLENYYSTFKCPLKRSERIADAEPQSKVTIPTSTRQPPQ